MNKLILDIENIKQLAPQQTLQQLSIIYNCSRESIRIFLQNNNIDYMCKNKRTSPHLLDKLFKEHINDFYNLINLRKGDIINTKDIKNILNLPKLYTPSAKKYLKKYNIPIILKNRGGLSSSIDREERNKKISKSMKGNPLAGGFREKSGRGKHGRYKDYFYSSIWELAYIHFNIKNNIIFKRNTEKFKYLWKNKSHYYIPDFILSDNCYVEIKGYISEQFKAKQNQFPHKLIVIDKNKILPYLKIALKDNIITKKEYKKTI